MTAIAQDTISQATPTAPAIIRPSVRQHSIKVELSTPAIGAELSNISLADAAQDADAIAEIRALWLKHKVLFFRDQPLTSAQHAAFARRFGELEIHPFLPANGEVPEVVRFAKSADVGWYENGWHHDVTWRETPSLGAVLHALDVPPSGGDTLFSDAYAALDGLDDDLRQRIDDLVAVHDFVHVCGHTMGEEKLAEMRAKHPPVQHPVVITHEVTGKDLLYLNRFFAPRQPEADGTLRDRDESRELMNRLCRSFEPVEHQVRFRWEPESVAFWDNPAVPHYSLLSTYPSPRQS